MPGANDVSRRSSYRQLLAWSFGGNFSSSTKRTRCLIDVNRAIPGIRRSEHQPLERQLFKSPLSVESNLAEGRTKHSQREFLRFLEIALGSAGELQQQLRAAVDCAALPLEEGTTLDKSAEEVAKMIQGLIKKIRRDLGDEDSTTPEQQ